MTIKRIQAEDVLGDKYYTYELSSSDYNPSLNDSITITCTLKDPYGNMIPNTSLALYQNGTLLSNATTNLNGVATWNNVLCDVKGVQVFKVGTVNMEVITDNMTFADYEEDMSAQDSTSIFLRELDNLIVAITGRGDL